VRKLLLRVIIGAVFALFGLINYYSNTVTNPVTGEEQRIQLSPKQEVVLGLQARDQTAAQFGGLLPDRTLQAYLDEVGERIVKQSSAAKSPYPYEFHLLSDPRTINAFALPGGQVFITTALLVRLKTEAQLAGVLGHEVGHVVGRHGAEHMAKQQLGAALVNAVGVAASDEYGGGRNAAMIAQAVQQLTSLKYGRADELESDRLGLQFMTQAGYDPRGIVEVMQILAQSRSGGGQPEFLSSHPDPGNRAEILKELITKAFANGIPPGLDQGRDRFAQVVGSRIRVRN
jgi:beta-barrel assembly-enhancing protease